MRALILLAALGGVAEAGNDGHELVGITAGTRAGDGGGFVLAQSDWNSSSGLTLTGGAEIPVWRRLRAVLRVQDFAGTGRPGAGLAYVVAPYATAYLLYKAEGFSEPGGEIEGALALAHGPFAGSLTFGQDADAKSRDVEGAAAARFPISDRVFAGAMARYRDALGTTGEALARDSFGGAVATVVVDRVAISALAGVAGVQRVGQHFEAGPAATLAIGAAF
ncbi:MAG: hypothetical protein JO257_35650 [Deltaproteobacteria bacterium]|nr:hypothetical protein [Deltaproteobacteria bacterium]